MAYPICYDLAFNIKDNRMSKLYFKSGNGIKHPKDVSGVEIVEGSILTFEWFDTDNPISEMRRKFSNMRSLSDEQISERIHKPTFIVKRNDNGVLFGEGLEDPKHSFMGKLYLHDFRFKYTKVVLSEA